MLQFVDGILFDNLVSNIIIKMGRLTNWDCPPGYNEYNSRWGVYCEC